MSVCRVKCLPSVSLLWNQAQIAGDSMPGKEIMVAWLEISMRRYLAAASAVDTGRDFWSGRCRKVMRHKTQVPKVEHDQIILETDSNPVTSLPRAFQQVQFKPPRPAGLMGDMEWRTKTHTVLGQNKHTHIYSLDYAYKGFMDDGKVNAFPFSFTLSALESWNAELRSHIRSHRSSVSHLRKKEKYKESFGKKNVVWFPGDPHILVVGTIEKGHVYLLISQI